MDIHWSQEGIRGIGYPPPGLNVQTGRSYMSLISKVLDFCFNTRRLKIFLKNKIESVKTGSNFFKKKEMKLMNTSSLNGQIWTI